MCMLDKNAQKGAVNELWKQTDTKAHRHPSIYHFRKSKHALPLNIISGPIHYN